MRRVLSTRIMKQMTLLTISTILHSRKIIPKECFKTTSFGELEDIPILDKKSEQLSARIIKESLDGVTEAIVKNYVNFFIQI